MASSRPAGGPRVDGGSEGGGLVAGLAAFGRGDIPRAGGKGANLGELVRAGFPVPDGFVVTTDAYAMLVEHAGLAPRIQRELANGATDGAAIRADLGAATVPDAVSAAILAAYAVLGGGPVAVRSSATAEDLPGAAFAGQQDTYLNVTGEAAVLDAVANCWASLWTERAIAYRRRRGVDQSTVRIAVVVQRMVAADVAGVMFTANPVSGDRAELVVDASAGLGEAVVSGFVTPDHYVLDRRGQVREWTPGRSEVVVRGAAGGGVTHDAAPGDAARLPDAALRELAELGTAVAAHFGRPQDTEWAVADGRLYLLQARPMTALPPPPVRLNPVQRKVGSVLLDYLPSRPYPLDMTTWMEHGPIGMMVKFFASLGLRADLMGAFREDEGVVDRIVPPTLRPTPTALLGPWRLARRARRFDPAQWERDARFAEYQERTQELAGRDLTTMPWPALVRMPREVLGLVDYITSLRIDYLPRCAVAFLRLRVATRLLGFRGAFSDLLVSRTTTTATNEALDALAARVHGDGALRQLFADHEPDQLVTTLRGDERFASFLAAFDDFLAEYGHRETTSPLMVSPPTWRDEPVTVLVLVKMLAERPPERAPEERLERAQGELLARPAVRRLRLEPKVRRWVDSARAGVRLREDSHFHFTKPLPILRRTLLEIGRRLAAAGVLAEPFDVFHLNLAELEGVGAETDLGGEVGARLRATALARSVKRDELAGVRLIDPRAVFTEHRRTADALVVGTPASGGRVTGPVRVIRESAEFGRLRTGDVLVCPYTNPAWTPLFERAVAVVVDAGSAASHAAIVAREYGIPAVMGAVDATSALVEGVAVTVDGDRGQVLAGEP